MIGIGQELCGEAQARPARPAGRTRAPACAATASSSTIPAEDVVPDDIVELQPGDQIVADGVVAASSSLALDESMLTGESDQVPKERGDRGAVGRLLRRRRRPVPRVGGRRRLVRREADRRGAGREAPPVARCSSRSTGCCGCCWLAMVPLAAILVAALRLHDTDFREAAQTATAGLISIVPEGLVLLASVTFAAGAVRIARTGALAQQLNAIESLASVDTVCLDKTGTLTDGTLELVEVVPAPGVPESAARQILARVAAAGSVRSAHVRRHLRVARRLAGADARRGAVRVALEVVGCGVRTTRCWCSARPRRSAPDRSRPRCRAARASAPGCSCSAGRRRYPSCRARATCRPPHPASRRSASPCCASACAPRRTRWSPTCASEGVDLKVMSGDAPGTVAAVARAAGFPDTSTVTGADLPTDPAALEEIAAAHAIFARVTPRPEEGADRGARPPRPVHGDGRRRRQRRRRR